MTPREFLPVQGRAAELRRARGSRVRRGITLGSGRVILRQGIGIRSRGGNQARRRRESTAAALATRDMRACYSRIFGLPDFPNSRKTRGHEPPPRGPSFGGILRSCCSRVIHYPFLPS